MKEILKGRGTTCERLLNVLTEPRFERVWRLRAGEGSGKCKDVGGEWRAHAKRGLRTCRMGEAQRLRVEQRARCAPALTLVGSRITVQWVAKHGTTQVLQMHADLMGAPRTDAHSDKSEAAVARECVHHTQRGPPRRGTPISDGHLDPIDGVATNGCSDHRCGLSRDARYEAPGAIVPRRQLAAVRTHATLGVRWWARAGPCFNTPGVHR